MNGYAVSFDSLYAPSGTATALEHGLSKYLKGREAPQSALEPQANQLARLFTQGSQQRLNRLRGFEDDWDGSGSAKPLAESIANAAARLPELYRLSVLHGAWREPHVSASETGEVTFEWWSDSRKVTLYFGERTLEVVRVWGLNIQTEMDLQPMTSLDDFPAIWFWLYGA